MKCPYCRISSMRRIVSGGKEIDYCTACGATWFDYGEIRELTEGRLPGEPGKEGESSCEPPIEAPPKRKTGAALSRVRAASSSLRCPNCEGKLTAFDFQATGIPVLRCPGCQGILAPRDSVAGIQAKFRFLREHGAMYAALGETIAGASRRRMETECGPAGKGASGEMAVPFPIVVPLADDAPETGSLPIITYGLIVASALLYIVGQVTGAPLPLPGGLQGLPSGTGFAGVPKLSLFLAPFFHAGILPLAAGLLFLFVLGDNVEDRLGMVTYFVFYMLCGVIAGAAHVLWGKTGGPPAQGSTGAVAGILGAYLVFFPDISIRMYGMGRIVRLPAYLFACAWVVALFLLAWRSGPIMELLNPAALSLAGNLAGFGTGIFGAIFWRICEDALEVRHL